MEQNQINLDAITLDDCVANYLLRGRVFLINDGHVVAIEEDYI
jgi:hypothetical protein